MSINQQQDGAEMLTYSLLVDTFPSFTRTSAESISYGIISLGGMVSIAPEGYHGYVELWSVLNKHYHKLKELQDKGFITEQTMMEILSQHVLFLERLSELHQHSGKVAVMCGGELFIGDTLNDAVTKAKSKYGDRPYYSETIDLIDIPSLFRSYAD